MHRKLLILPLLSLLMLFLLWPGNASAQSGQSITLKPGFNFISFKVSIPVSLDPLGFKALNTAIEDIYLYSPAAGTFLSANDGNLSTLGVGKGYIVKSSSTENVVVTVPGTALPEIKNISLKSGFNLVGFSKAPGSPTKFTGLMNNYSFISGIYKWNAAANTFISVVRDNEGVPVKLDGVDPSFEAGESYFFNLSEDILLNYDGANILMGKTIEPPVTANPYAGRYNGTFAGFSGAPRGSITLFVSTTGALTGEGYNESNTPPTPIRAEGSVTTDGEAVFYITFNNRHKFDGIFTTDDATGHFYELDGTTLKGSWNVVNAHAPMQQVAAPEISPIGGNFTAAQSVTITCATEGASIYYTTDHSTPSATNGTLYSSALNVSTTTVIKAIAIKSGMTDSTVTTATFVISAQPSGSLPFLRKFGSKGSGNGQFNQGPVNVAVEASTGYIFASDTYAHRIIKFDHSGNYVSTFGSLGSGNGQFMYPTGIAINGNEMFVVDYGNRRVQKLTTAGVFLKAFGSAGTGDGQFQEPDCVAVDKNGSVYVTDFSNNNVQRFSSEGVFIQKWGGRGTGDGQFGEKSPKDIAVDSFGNVYVADLGNNRVQKFNASGTYLTQWGTAGSGDGQFTSPHGVCVDNEGHVFVSDKSCRIQKFNSVGYFLLSWGGQGTADGKFDDPSGICSDSNGNIYVADFGNSRVQVFGSGSTPVAEKVATPSFTPEPGTYTSELQVTITCATEGAEIRYTHTGVEPTKTSALYTGPLNISFKTTIKAIAFKSGMTDSDVAIAHYDIQSAPQPGNTLTIDLGGGVSLEMVKISAAGKSFQMGSPANESGRNESDGPAHRVSFTRDYYIGKYEVTQAQWLKIQGYWPGLGTGEVPSASYGLGDSYPAYYVSWNDICDTGGFLENLNKAKPGGYSSFRLPSEAEWEYAARGGTQTRFYWGDDISGTSISNYAWYYDNSSNKTHTAGAKQPNAYGIYDITGNVNEWCLDYHAPYETYELIDPMGPSEGPHRVFRGGSFLNKLSDCRNSFRNGVHPDNRMDYCGFRLAMCLDNPGREAPVKK